MDATNRSKTKKWSIIWVGGGGEDLSDFWTTVKLPLVQFLAEIVQLGTFPYFEKVWCDGAGPKLVVLALPKVLGLWSLWFHNKGSSSKCEPQTGEICWNNQTFLKSGGREGGNLKFSCSNEISSCAKVWDFTIDKLLFPYICHASRILVLNSKC